MVRSICGVHLKDMKTFSDLMLMLCLSEVIYQMAMAYTVHWYDQVLRMKKGHQSLRLKVKGRIGAQKRNDRNRQRKKARGWVEHGRCILLCLKALVSVFFIILFLNVLYCLFIYNFYATHFVKLFVLRIHKILYVVFMSHNFIKYFILEDNHINSWIVNERFFFLYIHYGYL